MNEIDNAEYADVTHAQQEFADRIYGYVQAEAVSEFLPPYQAQKDFDGLVERARTLMGLEVILDLQADASRTARILVGGKLVRPIAGAQVRDSHLEDWENEPARRRD